jgi:hypothetical protein
MHLHHICSGMVELATGKASQQFFPTNSPSRSIVGFDMERPVRVGGNASLKPDRIKQFADLISSRSPESLSCLW